MVFGACALDADDHGPIKDRTTRAHLLGPSSQPFSMMGCDGWNIHGAGQEHSLCQNCPMTIHSAILLDISRSAVWYGMILSQCSLSPAITADDHSAQELTGLGGGSLFAFLFILARGVCALWSKHQIPPVEVRLRSYGCAYPCRVSIVLHVATAYPHTSSFKRGPPGHHQHRVRTCGLPRTFRRIGEWHCCLLALPSVIATRPIRLRSYIQQIQTLPDLSAFIRHTPGPVESTVVLTIERYRQHPYNGRPPGASPKGQTTPPKPIATKFRHVDDENCRRGNLWTCPIERPLHQ